MKRKCLTFALFLFSFPLIYFFISLLEPAKKNPTFNTNDLLMVATRAESERERQYTSRIQIRMQKILRDLDTLLLMCGYLWLDVAVLKGKRNQNFNGFAMGFGYVRWCAAVGGTGMQTISELNFRNARVEPLKRRCVAYTPRLHTKNAEQQLNRVVSPRRRLASQNKNQPTSQYRVSQTSFQL